MTDENEDYGGFVDTDTTQETEAEAEVTEDTITTEETSGEAEESATDEGAPGSIPYSRFKEVNDGKKAAEAALAERDKRIAALEEKVNNALDVKSLLEPKKAAPTIDDELKSMGIDPAGFEDSYDDEGNLELSAKAQKKLALQDAKTNATLQQMQAQQVLAATANDVEGAINSLRTTQPEYAEMLGNGITLLVSNQSFIMQENNPQMGENEADAAAYNAVMFELAKRARAQGKTPALVAAEMADRLAKRLNIPLAKPKAKEELSNAVDLKAREESKLRSGRPAIQAAARTAAVVDDDDRKLFAMF